MPIVSFEEAMGQPANTAPAAAPSGPKIVSFEEATAPRPNSGSRAGAYLSDFAKIPGDIVGTPRFLMKDVPEYLAQGQPAPAAPTDRLSAAHAQMHRAIADVGAALPSAEDFNQATGLAPHLVDHTNIVEKLLGAFIQGGGIRALTNPRGFLDLLKSGTGLGEVAKTGAATAAAQGAGEVDPGNLGLQMSAAALTHAAPSALRTMYPAVRPFVAPTATGTDIASAVGNDPTVNNAPGTAPTKPSAIDMMNATRNAQNNIWAMGPGETPPVAGADIKSALVNRQTDLTNARADLTKPFTEARDASTANISVKPVLNMIDDKLGTAAGAQKTAIIKARNNLLMAPMTGVPKWTVRSRADQLAASRQAISTQIDAAKTAGDNATAGHLLDIRGALDNQIESAVPEAKTAKDVFAAASRPLDPFDADKNTVSPVADAVARNQYGQVVGTPPSELPDAFLRGNATKEKLDNLLEAHGGNRTAAFDSLKDFLVGKMQAAVKDDGTLDSAAFDKTMAPYDEALHGNAAMHFPELRRQFADVKAAQKTLDTVTGQKELVDSLSNNGLRDMSVKGGVVTRGSVQSWLTKNVDKITATQSPATIMRWKQIAAAMPDDPLALGHKILAAAPLAAGVALGGETGIVGAVTGGKLIKMATSVPDARLMEAYSKTIEKIFADPDAANALGKDLSARRGGLSSSAKFKDTLRSAITALPAALRGAATGE